MLSNDLDLTSRVVLEALLNAAWQGVVLTAAIALLLHALPATSAATRHAVWWATLAAVVLLPLVPAMDSDFWHSLARSIDGQAQAGGGVRVGDVPDQATTRASGITWAPPRPWPAAILALLTGLVAVRLVRLGFSIRTLRRWKRQAVPLPAPIAAALSTVPGRPAVRGVRICQSHTIDGPITVGFRRPMILLPGYLLDRLSGDETALVVLHELAHVRRRDDWTHLAQKLLQAVFFFHPCVGWICARLDLEREMACDAEVVARLARPRSYALCLTRLAQLAVSSRRAMAPGAVPAHNQLTRRVGALIAPDRAVRIRLSHASLAAAVGLLVGGAATLRTVPALALAVASASGPAVLPATRALALRAPLRAAVPGGATADRRFQLPVAVPPPGSAARAIAAPDEPAVPEPRLAATCGSSVCARLPGPTPIAERVEIARRPTQGRSLTRGPAPSLDRSARPAGIQITVAVAAVPGAIPESASPVVVGTGGLFGAGGPFVPGRAVKRWRAGSWDPWRTRTPLPVAW